MIAPTNRAPASGPARRRLVLSMLAACTALIGSVATARAQEPVLPLPKGAKLAIGTSTLHFVDKKRAEVATKKKGDKRQLMVQIWYPAKPPKTRPASSSTSAEYSELYEYMPQFKVLVPALGSMYQQHGRALSALRVPAKAHLPARAGKRMPLVIFSPGLGTIRLLYTAQILSLVARGYIVAAVDHSYDADGVVCPGPELCKRVDATASESEGNAASGSGLRAGPRLRVWAQDLGFTLDRVLALDKDKNSVLHARIDRKRVAFVGHCFGARAAMLHAVKDSRVKAVVVQNPWPLAKESRTGKLRAPVLFVQGERIKEVVWLEKQGARKEDVAKLRERVKRQQIVFLRKLGSSVLRVEVAGQEHMDFTDIPMLGAWVAANAAGSPKREARRERVDALVADFLEKAFVDRRFEGLEIEREGMSSELVQPRKRR